MSTKKGQVKNVKQRKIGVPTDRIEKSVLLIRGQKVILDKDLAGLYGVQTKQLKRAVRRNINRFPKDFMFELSGEELENLESHFGTSSWEGARYRPMAFTEQGVAMLSSVLKSDRAIEVNIKEEKKDRSIIFQTQDLDQMRMQCAFSATVLIRFFRWMLSET